MARGRKAGTGRGRSASVSTPAAKDAPDDHQQGVQNCVSCSGDVGDSAIGCDRCERWVHNTVMCSGLPQHMIEAIAKYEGAGISFICTNCRLDRGNSPSGSQVPSNEIIVQLFQQIKGICSTVKELVDQVKALTTAVPAPQPAAPAPPPVPIPSEIPGSQQPTPDYRSIVHEELKEMKERDKRRQSVIIKGLRATSSSDLMAKFEQLTEQTMGTKVVLSDVTSISGHPHIYRAKIVNDDLRKTVLDKAKTLRNTDYSSVYISRDLTYAQRTELFARRKARQAELAQTQNPPRDRSQTRGNPLPSALRACLQALNLSRETSVCPRLQDCSW